MTPTGKSALLQEPSIIFQAFASVSSNFSRQFADWEFWVSCQEKHQTLIPAYCIGNFISFEAVTVCLSRPSKPGLLFVGAPAGTVSIWLKIKRFLIHENSGDKKVF